MPGWYIHMDVARKSLASLASNAGAAPVFAGASGPTPAQLTAIAQNNPAYVALGAIGPDIFFLLPDFKPPKGSMLWGAANTIMQIYEWWDTNFLGPYEDILGPISDNFADELGALTGGLSTQLSDIMSRALSFLIDTIIVLITRQVDVFAFLGSGVGAGYDEQVFFWSDMLHYRKTYEFGARLWQDADARNDDRFRAFALGWMTHLATDVTGHPFVNQKAGGPYRLHWQRHHLVENHMDARVYDSEHGQDAVYQMISCAALHLWIAFNGDGTSHANFFNSQPGPSYDTGDSTPAVLDRKSKWDVDSDLPDDLADFLAQALRDVFNPKVTGSPDLYSPNSSATDNPMGQWACCPTILTAITDRLPDPDNKTGATTRGYVVGQDISTTYWWLYKYVKWTTTDFFKLLRPDPPDVVNVPPFPSPPGTGESDAGPGGSDDDFWQDLLDILLSLLAWLTYIQQVAAWPATVLAGVISSAGTYPVRELLYETIEVPLYNAWLAMHWYLSMTGFTSPMTQEISPGLTTLGTGVADVWQTVQDALNDPTGGLNVPPPTGNEPSGFGADGLYPRGVVVDPPSSITPTVNLISGSPCVDPKEPASQEAPSEFLRPWLFPFKDRQGDVVFSEFPHTKAGPYLTPHDATVLMGGSPGDPHARTDFEGAKNEGETIAAQLRNLPERHLGDPVDYSAYVIAHLTRKNAVPAANFNLDADRGYGYLCWDWLRNSDTQVTAIPRVFAPPDQRRYRVPTQAGYGWCNQDQDQPQDPVTHQVKNRAPMFDPTQDVQKVKIRYLDREKKV